MMKYGITAATGKFGKAAIQALNQLVPASDIVALARNTEKAKAVVPEGVEVRAGDYTKPEELKKSLTGIDRLLFISSVPGGPVTREEQHLNVVESAKEAGVSYIAYTSFPHLEEATALLAIDHRTTEAAILKAGIAHSFLRNNWYLENELSNLKNAVAGKPFVYSAGEGRTGWALEREYAEAAAKVLVLEAPKEIYEFSGKGLTHQELAANIPGDFEVVSLDDAAYKKGLEESGLDAETANFVTLIQGWIRQGELDGNDAELKAVLGHDLVPIDKAIKEVTEK